MTDAQETLAQAVERLGLSIRAEFIPFSKSRSAGDKDRSLNWRVTLVKRRENADGDARYSDIVATDYTAGIGHCPAYKATVAQAGGPRSVLRGRAIEKETETGRETRFAPAGFAMNQNGPAIMPDALNVMHSLALDSEVLDYSRFEEWASECGFDPDSRKAETIYRECLSIALALRNGIGETALAELRAAASEY